MAFNPFSFSKQALLSFLRRAEPASSSSSAAAAVSTQPSASNSASGGKAGASALTTAAGVRNMAQKLTPDQQEAVIQKFRSEMAQQAMQELVQKMTDKCFAKCAGKSGNRLESKEQNCIAMCMDRYIETMNVVQHTLSERSATR